MQIIYCETCGHRIPNEDLDAGRVVVDDFKYYCANCLPRTDVQRPAGRSSRKIVLVNPAPAVAAPSRRNIAAATVPAARQANDQHSSNKHHPATGSGTHSVLPVAVGIGLFVLGAIALFTLSSTSAAPNKREANPKATVASMKPAPSTPIPASTEKTPAVHAQGATASVQPEAMPANGGAVVIDKEQMADDALAAVLRWDGAPATNPAERIKRLDDFIARFNDSRAAARAQLMITYLRSETEALSGADAASANHLPAEKVGSAGAVSQPQTGTGANAAPQVSDAPGVDDVPAARKAADPQSKPDGVVAALVAPVVSAPAPEREAGANKAWAALLKLSDARDFKGLDEGLKKFNEVSGGTHFLEEHGAEIRALGDYVKASTSIDKGLAGWWKLDEASGTKAADSSGNGNHGTLNGHPVWGRGKYGAALAFTTRDDDVVIPNSATVERVQEGDYTISAWVRPEEMLPTKDTCLLSYTILAKPGWHEGLFYERTGYFTSWHELGSNVVCTSFHRYPAGILHHVAATVSRATGTSHLFVDGVPDGALSWNAGENPRDFGQETWRIGQAQLGNKQYAFPFRGMIDDVRLYNRVLTPAEIAVLAEMPFKKFYVPEQPSAARFLGIDENTHGNWKSAYGAAGHLIIGDSHSAPANVQFNQSGGNFYVHALNTRDGRGLQRAGDGERIVAGLFSESSFTLDFNFLDGRPHRVSLYCCDWDQMQRSAKFEVTDVNGTVLDTRELAEYSKGKYLNWELKGHVKIVAHSIKVNVLVNAIFFNL